jgi:hypothetical protein
MRKIRKGAAMFKVIEPKYHCFYPSCINRFTERIKSRTHVRFSQREQNRATFILTNNEEKDFEGGAILLKKKLKDFPSELVNVLSDFVPSQEDMWQCVVFISFEKDSPLYETDEMLHFCQIFYRKLYNRLVGFGKKEGTGFLCVSLDSEEYLCTEGLISWPYVFELKPQDSCDGLFHGILPLTGGPYEDYQRSWQDLDFPSQEKKIAFG